jgi:hypothetical protein
MQAAFPRAGVAGTGLPVDIGHARVLDVEAATVFRGDMQTLWQELSAQTCGNLASAH